MKKSYPKRDLYQEVTDRIITALESGVKPWNCPWDRTGSVPTNLKSGNPYRGINFVLFSLMQMIKGYKSGYWLTFKQAQELGGRVRKGEKGTSGVFYKLLERENGETDDNGDDVKKTIPLLRGFTAFNLDQIDGIQAPDQAFGGISSPLAANALAERIMASSGVPISHGGARACYRPASDAITLPDKSRFARAEDYYATALHELTHATGHASRCNRTPYSDEYRSAYAFEELVAEIGSAFLCAYVAICGDVQHESYVGSWLKILRDDKRAVMKAASQAQHAADWLLDRAGSTEHERAA
jgi:antirestriction protein ArdC